jgi:hypothetical protein
MNENLFVDKLCEVVKHVPAAQIKLGRRHEDAWQAALLLNE